MKARQLPSKKWQTQPSFFDTKGVRHRKSIVADTKEEAEFLAKKFKREHKEGVYAGTVAEMVRNAIAEKEAVLSPATIRGYLKVLKNNIVQSPFAKARVVSLKNRDVQSWVSWMVTQGYAPKSVKNAYGVFQSSYQFYGGEKKFRVRLPPMNRKRKHVPSESDVRAVLEFFADDPDMTAAINLCAFGGLRRGEACALTAKDVNRHTKTIRVNKALTLTLDGSWVTKSPKTFSSIRDAKVGDAVLESLPKSGKCVNIPPSAVTNRFCRAVKQIGVKPFSLHDLRHFHASLAHFLGVAEFAIQYNDGWASQATMKDIYYGGIEEQHRKQMDILNNYIDINFRNKLSVRESCTNPSEIGNRTS